MSPQASELYLAALLEEAGATREEALAVARLTHDASSLPEHLGNALRRHARELSQRVMAIEKTTDAIWDVVKKNYPAADERAESPDDYGTTLHGRVINAAMRERRPS